MKNLQHNMACFMLPKKEIQIVLIGELLRSMCFGIYNMV